MRFVRPRKIFLIYMTGAWVFCAIAITQTGSVGVAMLCITLFFER
jgi:FHS family L-fucose permease-like MFS transporter